MSRNPLVVTQLKRLLFGVYALLEREIDGSSIVLFDPKTARRSARGPKEALDPGADFLLGVRVSIQEVSQKD
jgi:hypothetical protein